MGSSYHSYMAGLSGSPHIQSIPGVGMGKTGRVRQADHPALTPPLSLQMSKVGPNPITHVHSIPLSSSPLPTSALFLSLHGREQIRQLLLKPGWAVASPQRRAVASHNHFLSRSLIHKNVREFRKMFTICKN